MNYRQTRNGYCNCNVAMFPGVGPYNVPNVRPASVGSGELAHLLPSMKYHSGPTAATK